MTIGDSVGLRVRPDPRFLELSPKPDEHEPDAHLVPPSNGREQVARATLTLTEGANPGALWRQVGAGETS